jgi:hypothetical protein
MRTIKVIDTPTLLAVAATARRWGFDRLLPERVRRRLDPLGHHILQRPKAVDKGLAVRCWAQLKLRGRMRPCVGRLDLDYSDWLGLMDYRPEDWLPDSAA